VSAISDNECFHVRNACQKQKEEKNATAKAGKATTTTTAAPGGKINMQQRKRAAATNVSYFHVALILTSPPIFQHYFFRISCPRRDFYFAFHSPQLFR